MERDTFKQIFDEGLAAITESGRMSLRDRLAQANPATYYGTSARESVSRLGAELEASRPASDGSVFDEYLGDLDVLTQNLGSLTKFTNNSGRKIRTRADLRAMRQRAISERRQAKKRLSELKVERLDEDVYFIDPESGERKRLTQDTTLASLMPSGRMTADIQEAAAQYYDERIEEMFTQRYDERRAQDVEFNTRLAAGEFDDMLGGRPEERDEAATEAMLRQDIRDEMLGIRRPDQVIGAPGAERQTYEEFGDTSAAQARSAYAQLAASAVQNQASAMAGELRVRMDAAQMEADARKKANIQITEGERARLKQARDIDKSIQSINQTFAKADADFLSSLTSGVDGIDFRADRPQ